MGLYFRFGKRAHRSKSEFTVATAVEVAIRQLLDHLVDAWNRGDAKAYGASYRSDGTFTNVNGTLHVGREEFDRRHDEVFRGVFKGTTLAMAIKVLRSIAANVAVVDIDVTILGCTLQPPGVQVGKDGSLHTCLLMVLIKESDAWTIAAYHNVWRAAKS
jgi:uncharacterized protein (TIGR02246 family)